MLRQQSANSTSSGSCISFLRRELLSCARSRVSSSCRRWGFSSKSLSSSDSPARRKKPELQTHLSYPEQTFKGTNTTFNAPRLGLSCSSVQSSSSLPPVPRVTQELEFLQRDAILLVLLAQDVLQAPGAVSGARGGALPGRLPLPLPPGLGRAALCGHTRVSSGPAPAPPGPPRPHSPRWVRQHGTEQLREGEHGA